MISYRITDFTRLPRKIIMSARFFLILHSLANLILHSYC